MKRFLIALLIILVIAGIVAAGYYLSSKKSVPVAGTPGTLPSPAGTLPQVTTSSASPATGTPTPVGLNNAVSGLSLVSQDKFVAYTVATSGLVYGVSPDGRIFSVNQSGASTFLSASTIDDFSGASFSSDGKKILAFWGGASSPQFSVFDVASSTWQALPVGTVSAGWKPQSHVLAYLQDKNGVKNLYSWNLDKPKTNAQLLLQVYFEDITVGYLTPDKIFLSEESTGLAGSSFWVFDVSQKTLSTIITEAPGSLLKWNSAGTEFIGFSGSPNGTGGTLRLADASGNTISTFQSFLTLPPKCLFAPDVFATTTPISTSTKVVQPPAPLEDFIYCAVPRDQNTFTQSLLPDSYEKLSLLTQDDIYRINTENGLISTVFADPSKSFDVEEPMISGTTFFFINRYDQNLYALPIPE